MWRHYVTADAFLGLLRDALGEGLDLLLAAAAGLLDACRLLWEKVVLVEPVTLAAIIIVAFLRFRDRSYSLQPWRRACRDRMGWFWYQRHWRRHTTDQRVARAIREFLRSNAPFEGNLSAIAVDDILAEAVMDPNPGPAYLTPEFRTMRELLAEALDPKYEGILVRYMLNGAWATSHAKLRSLLDYCDQFADLTPVSYQDQSETSTFGTAVSAITGAIVVADMSEHKAGMADAVVTWHRPQWTGRAPKCSNSTSPTIRPKYSTPFDYFRTDQLRTHVSLSEYNGRVPTLSRVEVCQRPGFDGASIVVHTQESDYYSTEPYSGDRQHGYREARTESKKLLPSRHDSLYPTFGPIRDRAGKPLIGAESDSSATDTTEPFDAERAVLLNGKLGLVSETADATYLVLMVRSGKVSNAARCLTQAAGGVMELPVGPEVRHGDPFGAVDFVRGVQAETQEELGLQPDDYEMGASTVFLSNNRTRPTVDDAGAYKRATGELVATVMFTGVTHLKPETILKRRSRASATRGLYEQHSLLFVPMGESAATFARNLLEGYWTRSTADAGSERRPIRSDFRADPHPHQPSFRIVDWLDQAALVSALYASRNTFGSEATAAAFRDAMHGVPWWARAWPTLPSGALSRVCREPASLFVDPESGERPFDDWSRDLWGGIPRPIGFDMDTANSTAWEDAISTLLEERKQMFTLDGVGTHG
ncbi:hypothetical protein [Nocardioides sp. YIM 152588]|uniref:hypothetical protein n=1 Tax=Nocardioides sp. YIM 152588 TaxID=3158259 RepID=UPI0032E3F22D